MTDNLELWNKVEKTDPKHTKPIEGKSYKGTSPKPHYLIHKATDTFGPIGIGWGFTIVDERIEEGAGGERMHIARVRVWYEWPNRKGEYVRAEVEHIGGTQFSGMRSSGKPFTDEDAPKKSVTDALIKALSMIGFAGDIFMGRYDDSKYVSDLRAEPTEKPVQPAMTYAAHLGAITSAATMDGLKAAVAAVNANKSLSTQDKADLAVAKDARKAALTKPADYVEPSFPGDA